MFRLILLIVTIYFLMGAVITSITNRKKPQQKKGRWVKFGFYFLIVYTVLVYAHVLPAYFYLFAVTIVLTGYYELCKIWPGSARSISFFVMALAIYSLIALCFVCFCYRENDTRLLWIYMLVLTFDGFSQLGGQLFGKIKIGGKISPNKTLEGLLTGLAMVVFTAWILKPCFSEAMSLLSYFVCVGLLCFFAFASDLLASWYKRQCFVKDYSNLIPGHGGVLDRFDSFIGAAFGFMLLSVIIP